jgi:hypothetical protein
MHFVAESATEDAAEFHAMCGASSTRCARAGI